MSVENVEIQFAGMLMLLCRNWECDSPAYLTLPKRTVVPKETGTKVLDLS
jgi:hypothetical protein